MVVFYTFTCCFSLGHPFLLGFGEDFFFLAGGAHNIIVEVDILSFVFLNISEEQMSMTNLPRRLKLKVFNVLLEVGIKRTFTYIHNVGQSFQHTRG